MRRLLMFVVLPLVVTSRAAPSGSKDGDVFSGIGPAKSSSSLDDAVQQLEALKHTGKEHASTEHVPSESTSTELAVQDHPDTSKTQQERDLATVMQVDIEGAPPRQMATSGLLPFSKEYTKRSKPLSPMLGSRTGDLSPVPLSVGMAETPRGDIRSLLEGDSINYTPLDLAMYVYKTGDEDGVILAIEELMAQRVMSISEALNFLRQIRDNLRLLSEQDEEMKDFPLDSQDMSKKRSPLLDELDYEAAMERVRGDSGPLTSNNIQEQLYTEFSLEEIIYQLARLFIAQANRYEGDAGSARALQDVAALLEKEVARGTISRQMEREVLDVIVTSLVDTMSENSVMPGPGPFIGGTGLESLKPEELLEPKKREDASAMGTKKASDKRSKE
ncbi:uncharacterized protein LOC143039617 isoform X2 [Oratosquilla oratoria]|uniref:uncharacterized protein LOC143039617 isoform X2 n=1 Tax=Oratosquilla oratoria TaxID=337810 RepID=UPI003F764002